MASAPSSCHLEATLTNLHQTFHSKHSSLEYCNILFLCPHLAETFLTHPQLIYHPHDNYGEGNGSPLQSSCLENPMDGGAW